MGFKWLFLGLLPLFVFGSNLDELINLSLNNEAYLSKELALLRAQSERKSAFRAYLPELSLKGGYMGNSLDTFLSDPKDSLFARLSLNFLLYDGGKREANLKALEFAEKLAHLAKEQSKNYLALSAATLYFNHQSMQGLIKTSEQKELFLKNTLNRLESFNKAGLSSKDALETVRAKFHLSSLELHKNRLKLIEIEKNLQELSQKNFIPQAGARLKDLGFESANNLDLLIAQEQANLAKARLNAARAEYLPRFFIQNNLSWYKNNFEISVPPLFETVSADFIDKYFKKNSRNNQFILGFEWKIFDFFSTNAKIEAQRLDLQIQRLNLNYVERKTRLDLDFLRKELEILKEQIGALSLANEAASLAFESVDRKYSAGLNSYNDYLQALESKFKAQSDLELAKNEFEIAKARYYFLSGLDIKERIIK
ncbi:TolC family protein [Campylobacter troglodytis]|uniref:TolC family protein n=1 Tax=Campylobacter troglodytis TaxID=654363 RepID=UPI001159CF9A|nr:TolC family protein [Campylobacter troglodytis]TQR60269.1 TolC family protein [Campylobacter troglodytis]